MPEALFAGNSQTLRQGSRSGDSAYAGRLHLVQQDQDRYQVRQVAYQVDNQPFVLLQFSPSISNQPMNLKIFIVPGVVPQAAAEPARLREEPAIQGAECNVS